MLFSMIYTLEIAAFVVSHRVLCLPRRIQNECTALFLLAQSSENISRNKCPRQCGTFFFFDWASHTRSPQIASQSKKKKNRNEPAQLRISHCRASALSTRQEEIRCSRLRCRFVRDSFYAIMKERIEKKVRRNNNHYVNIVRSLYAVHYTA